MKDVKVIPGEEIAKQRHLLVCDFYVDIPYPAQQKFVPHLRTWCLREPEAQTEYQQAFITGKISRNASGSGTERTWGKCLGKAAENVCGSTKKHWWQKETWWWNAAVNSAVMKKWICWKTWKKGGRKGEYKRPSASPNKLSIWQNPKLSKTFSRTLSPNSTDLLSITNQMRCKNLNVQGEKPVCSDVGKLCLDDRAKQDAWKGHY